MVEQAGFAYWFAEHEIRPGDPLVDTISQAIVDSDCMIVILSKDSAKSSWVEFEAERAYAAQKIILPIRIGDAPIPNFMMTIAYLQVSGDSLTAEEKVLITQGLQRILARRKEQSR